MTGEIHPDAISHGKVSNPLAKCIDDASAVLIWNHLRKRRRCTVPGAKPRLPVGWVHTGNDDADAHFARRWFDDVAIHELKNRWVPRT
jgi:hypothetical protein